MGLSHADVLVDADAKCVIDINTRRITSTSPKNLLVQYDHNSERIGFTMDRYNDGHDMSLSDRVTIVFSNGSTADSYVVDDVALSDDESQVTFTWLVSNSATQEANTLKFLVNFRCYDTDGNVTYNWSTAISSLFTVSASIDAPPDTVTPDFIDALEDIRKKLQEAFDEDIPGAVDEYLTENPVTMKTLTFAGGVKETYDGTAEKTVNIPTELKNPKALTFTGDVEATYDGSEEASIEITNTIKDAEGNKYRLSIEDGLLVITQTGGAA